MAMFLLGNDHLALRDFDLGLQLFDKCPEEHCTENFNHWYRNATWNESIRRSISQAVDLPNLASGIENNLDSHVSLINIITVTGFAKSVHIGTKTEIIY